ncbi:uncharacterized protein LOC114537304 [Dendronephthya gigantea]|uniref:uncharacterized protein LOC114537304 n=1 Tax=Dendronephthya gigantea TaxID=151771 RepID=UPI00106D4CED|nr:uncharacterized protein LOC114537304 [Dendronephthya gigantea]
MSLSPKIDEISHTLNSISADIGLFTETWLQDTVPDDAINIEGYQLFRRDRANRIHGGVCMYVKESIHCKILSDFYHTDHEVFWAYLRPRRLPRGFSNIVIAVVYQPPSANDVEMKEYLIQSLERLEAEYPHCAVFLAGDFNKTLLPLVKSAVKNFQLKPMVKQPTRGDNILDQIFTNCKEYLSDSVRILPPFGYSDHRTVFIEAKIRPKPSKPRNRIVVFRDKRPTKVASVGRFLQQVPWLELLSNYQTCEEKLKLLTEIINYGLNTIMPEQCIKMHENDRPWLNTRLKKMINSRQKAFSSGNRILYKMLRNKVNRECKHSRKTYYESKIGQMKDSTPRDWWREVKNLCGINKNSRRDLRSLLHPDLVCDDFTLTNNINKAFISVMNDYSPLTDYTCVDAVDDEPLYVTEESVARKLRAIKISRASGPDNLPNWVLKTFSDIIASPITDILNTSFTECRVPNVWKLADVCPLPKSSLICDFNNDIRPISLTSTLSKVAESFVIDMALKPVMLSIVDPRQFGFIPGSSTTMALIDMFHHWLSATDGTSSTIRTVLLDFRKAFDLVDHHILIAKLFSIGVKPTIVNWIIDFLRHRQQRVKYDGTFSNWVDVHAGVPQGTRLGPWLFLILINDLRLPDQISQMWKFADDITLSEVITQSNESSIQDAVDYVNLWSKENHLQLKPTKCKEIQSCFKIIPPSFVPIEIDWIKFDKVSTARLLGVTIRDDFNWIDHVKTITAKASKHLYLLRQLKRAGLSVDDMKAFYCSVVRSVLEYCCQLFHRNFPNYLSNDLERIQKRALRIIFPHQSYNEALKEAFIPTLFDRREMLSQSLFKDIVVNGNHKLAGLLPPRNSCNGFLRNNRTFNTPQCRTDRFKNSFIMSFSTEANFAN